MDPALRLGLELPLAGVGAAAWRAAAVAAESAGFGTVWVAPGGGDPCTAAGTLVAATTSAVLGIVAGTGPGDRAPSVLAREATTVDVLSGGRAAVLLQGGDPDRLAEALAVCRLLFTEDAPSYHGRHFTLVGAANRPPPVRPDGPPVLVAPPTGADVTGVLGARPDAVVVDGGAADVAAWRSVTGPAPAPGTRTRPALVWRGRLAAGGDAGPQLAEVAAAGADGVLVRPPYGPPETWPAVVAQATEALAGAWGRTT